MEPKKPWGFLGQQRKVKGLVGNECSEPTGDVYRVSVSLLSIGL